MDQNPETQGEKSPKQEAELANDRPAEPTEHEATIVETITTETVAESKPSEQLSGPTATEIITETTTQTVGEMPVVADDAKPKKKRKGLTCLIAVLLVLILAVVGAGIWYFAYYNNPNKVMYDAVTGFLEQKTVVTDGTIHGVINLDSNDISIVAGIKSKNNGIAGENVLSLKAMVLDANGEPISENDYEVELSAAVMGDGVFYIRVDKLEETVEMLLDDLSVTSPDDLDDVMVAIRKLVNNIDGEWWQIDVPDIIDTVISDSEVSRPAKEFYACLVNVAKNNINEQLAGVYRNNQFIIAKKTSSGVESFDFSTYAISFDYDKMSSFASELMNTDYVKSAENCFNKFFVEDLGGEMDYDHSVPTADELEQAFEQIGTLSITVNNFSHELKTVSFAHHFDEDDDAHYVSGGFELSHPEVTINAPEKYRSIDELVELIIEAVMEINDVPDDAFDDGATLDYDEDLGEWYIVDEEVDDTEEV